MRHARLSLHPVPLAHYHRSLSLPTHSPSLLQSRRSFHLLRWVCRERERSERWKWKWKCDLIQYFLAPLSPFCPCVISISLHQILVSMLWMVMTLIRRLTWLKTFISPSSDRRVNAVSRRPHPARYSRVMSPYRSSDHVLFPHSFPSLDRSFLTHSWLKR